MRVGHWDAVFGMSGDMALGAALAAGASLEAVNGALQGLGVPGLRIEVEGVLRGGVACTRALVRWDAHREDQHGHGGHPHRPYREVRRLLAAAGLEGAVRDRALAVFARLAEAEARVHGGPVDEVVFHEVGAEDALGDVVGTVAALVDLGLEDLTVSPLPAGGGTVQAAHGLLPVPAPAVAYLLEGFEVWEGPAAAELVTPTGAALVAALARPARGWPAMTVRGVGWGAGARDERGHPNALRLVWGEAPAPSARGGWRRERLVEVETHLDDQTPEGVGHLFQRLLAAGALDVAVSPLFMKKQRPGVRVWALAEPARADAVVRCLFAESTTFGVRVREVERLALEREVVRVATPYGEVSVKVGRLEGRVVQAAPEYEDCRRLAEAAGVPLALVVGHAMAAWAARAAG
jgi:uncharacterized protein (TIGR00299 family) protein